MRGLDWLMPEEASRAQAGSVLDLSQYAHPASAAQAAETLASLPEGERSRIIPLLPPDETAWWEAIARTASVIALDGVRDAAHAEELARRLPPGTHVVARLRRGAALHHAESIILTLRGALAERLLGIWYAAADLLVDLADDPGSLYLVDLDEPRLAAPSWVRSRCLTLARTHGLELWGQLDVTFADAPADEELHRVRRLAEASGFDVLVEARADGRGSNA